MACKMFYQTNYSNLTRLHKDITLFSNRQFDWLFDTAHTVIRVT